jgi:hypothetical protein
MRNLMTMKKMVGVESFQNLTLVTSMWDLADPVNCESREKELVENYWQDLIKEGAVVGRFRGDRSSALRILNSIKVGADLTLTIQREIVDESLSLDRTAAGSYLDHEFLRLVDAENKKVRGDKTGLNDNKGEPSSLIRTDKEAVTQLQKNIKELQELNSSGIVDMSSLWLTPDPTQNDTMDPPIYESLHGDEFRLVQLRAGKCSVPVEISLVVADLSRPPPYAALSYVVGQDNKLVPVDFRRKQRVSPIEITENLENALRSLRLENRDVHIWIDALSVNQLDFQERAREVRRMSRIFQSAANVCIWLGPSNDETEFAMDFISDILDFSRLEDIVKDNSSKPKWLLLAKLMSRPWFRRRWVVQEIILAQAATVHCGRRVVSWSDFVDAATLFQSKWSDIRRLTNMTDAEALELGDAHLLGAISLIEVSRVIFRKDSVGKVLQRLLDLETLLSLLPTFEVTELLDAVYAIIDLASDIAGTQKLRIDYRLQPEELFRDVTKLIVESSGSLDIICRPWAPKSGLPSWIPTLAKYAFKRRATGPQYDRQQGVCLVGMPHSRAYRACGSYTAKGNVTFREESVQQILSARGLTLGSIKELGDRCRNGNIPAEWMTIGGWEDLDKPVPVRLWRTLVANRCQDGSTVPEWYGRACQFAFRQSTRDDIDTSFLMKTISSSNVREFLNRVQEVIWRRTLASIARDDRTSIVSVNLKSAKGLIDYLALCPPDAKEDDKVCILYGCSVPVLLRKHRSYYKLIGECFVYGMMDGEAMTERTPDSATQIYDIV